MLELDKEEFCPAKESWDAFPLRVLPEAQANMEDKLITESDIRELIYRAEAEGDYFEDDQGIRTASMQKEVLTFWADYAPEAEGGYSLLNAYCHRMFIGEGGK